MAKSSILKSSARFVLSQQKGTMAIGRSIHIHRGATVVISRTAATVSASSSIMALIIQNPSLAPSLSSSFSKSPPIATRQQQQPQQLNYHPTTTALPRTTTRPFTTSQPPQFPNNNTNSNNSNNRPFKILGLQQIAIGSLDKSTLSHLWTNIFGIEKIGNYVSEKENVNEDILRLGKEGSPYCVEVDLMMPVDAEKSPKVHIPPLNHIGLWIDNLPAAVTWMESQGVRFTPGGIRKGASGHDVTFIHPKGNEKCPIGGGGVLIELVQAPKEVVEAMMS